MHVRTYARTEQTHAMYCGSGSLLHQVVADSNSDDDEPVAHDAEQRPHAIVVLGHLQEPPHACLVIEHLSFVFENF